MAPPCKGPNCQAWPKREVPGEASHPLGKASALSGWPRQRTSFPESPYLLVMHAEAWQGPHIWLPVAGILTVVLHLRLSQAAAQGAHPVSPAEVGKAQ